MSPFSTLHRISKDDNEIKNIQYNGIIIQTIQSAYFVNISTHFFLKQNTRGAVIKTLVKQFQLEVQTDFKT